MTLHLKLGLHGFNIFSDVTDISVKKHFWPFPATRFLHSSSYFLEIAFGEEKFDLARSWRRHRSNEMQAARTENWPKQQKKEIFLISF